MATTDGTDTGPAGALFVRVGTGSDEVLLVHKTSGIGWDIPGSGRAGGILAAEVSAVHRVGSDTRNVIYGRAVDVPRALGATVYEL